VGVKRRDDETERVFQGVLGVGFLGRQLDPPRFRSLAPRLCTKSCFIRKSSATNGVTWRDAVKRAGLEDFRWHDLRHTWASWHVQQGTPLHVLQELCGWETAEMVRRYAHLAPEHLAEYAEKLAKPRVVDITGTNLAQGKNGTEKKRDHIAVVP
jgi:integrase